METVDLSNVEKRKMYAVVTNTDLTEGRGRQYTKGIAELEATAHRIAKNAGVQGCDAEVWPVDVFVINNIMYAHNFMILEATPEDRENEKVFAERRELLKKKAEVSQKAKDLGLTIEEIKILMMR